MKNPRIIWLCKLIVATLPVSGCTKHDEKPAAINVEDQVIVRHRVQVCTRAHWRAERWFNCTAIRHGSLCVSFRVDAGPNHSCLPRAAGTLELRGAGNNTLIKRVESKLLFEDCRRMESRTEQTYDDLTESRGELEHFPPLTPCWEASLIDPFGRMGPGAYLVLSRLTLDDGSVFEYDPVEIHVY